MAAEVGQLTIALSLDDKSFDNSLKKVETANNTSSDKMKTAWDKASVLAASAINRAFNKIADAISGSMDAAIQRVDTLNNANRVFEAMGYSAESVAGSMETLNTYLDGLPTSMTDAVSSVQALSASFGGIEKGTDYFVALNDAGLAFGASSDQISNAINQLGQLSLDGPLDAQTWNSLRNSGFGPVFAAMAEEAGTTVGALKEDFGGNGTKTVEDFLDTLTRLDTEGTASMASLSEMARTNTDGIGTAMENVQNRIGKAVSSVIDAVGSGNVANAINTFSSSFGDLANGITAAFNDEDPSDSINTFINKMGGALNDGLGQVGTIIGKLMPVILDGIFGILPDLLQGIVDLLINLVNELGPQLPHLITSFLDSLTSSLPILLEGIVQAVIAIADVLTQPETLTAILQGALTMFMAIVHALPDLIVALVNALPSIIQNVVDFLTNPATIMMILQAAIEVFMAIVQAVPQILGSLIQAFGTLVGNLWNSITTMFANFAANFGSFIGGIFAGAINMVLGFIENFLNAPINLINGFIGVINGAFGWLGVNIGYIDLIALPRVAFAKGGIVPGADYSGDNVLARVNSGEMVITRSQQAALWRAIESGEFGQKHGMPEPATTGISGWSNPALSGWGDENEGPGTSSDSLTVIQNNTVNNELDIDRVANELLTIIRRSN